MLEEQVDDAALAAVGVVRVKAGLVVLRVKAGLVVLRVVTDGFR